MFHMDWEPSNGMAHRPWLMFFGLIFSMIAWVGGLLLCFLAGFRITSESETAMVETDFVGFETGRTELHLTTSVNETYIVDFYRYFMDDPAFLCAGETYTIWVTEAGYICAMMDSTGNWIITFESEREAYRYGQRGAVVLMAAFLVLTMTYFVLALFAGKNPERFPAWLVKLLFENPSDFWS